VIQDTEAAVHLLAIRKALSNGNAAVMVGSGFSFNAEGGSQLASWDALASAILDDLDPTRDKTDSKIPPSLITQLGEQYARVFSQSALDDLLKRMVPDEKVSPGALHKQLLRLPWSEIFTTNYDTLLERATEDIPEKAHYTVICREDIPQSKILERRRIVKLHGSFPAQRPFIFTEEHYRRYPSDFAPFVNLVRQALLENVFCLFGFSGDDPNFLHWIGWVRDMLDTHALPIYLFVSSPPTLGQRKLLEARRVTAIVLPLPNDCASDDYATRYDALFRHLATPIKPSDIEWGKNLRIPTELSTYTADDKEKYTRLLRIFPQLKTLRDTYPGWIVAPIKARRNLQHSIEWLPLMLETLKVYTDFVVSSPLVAITLLAQYGWQQDVLLQCFDDKLAASAFQFIKSAKPPFDANAFTIEATQLKELGVHSIREAQIQWRNLAVNLLRWSREELHDSIFEDLKSMLLEAFPNDGELLDEVSHQSILLALYMGELDVARRLVLDWNVQSSNIYMDIRKASLLAEVGELDVGLTTGVEALQRIRRQQKLYPDSARYFSEEAWACLIIRNMLDAKTHSLWYGGAKPKKTGDGSTSEEMEARLADLARRGYDVIFETSEIKSDLNAEALPPSQPRYRSRGFELGHYPTGLRYGMGEDLRYKITASFAWLTLTDRISLAPRMGNVSFELTSFTQAAWWTQYFDSFQRVLSVAIRTLSTDVLKAADDSKPAHRTGWLSRFQVAKTGEELALQICKRSLGLVERTLRSNDEARKVSDFHLEVFSRLVLRIRDTSEILAFAERVISLHTNPNVAQLPDVWEELGKALARCWEALPRSLQDKLVPQIIGICMAPAARRVHEHLMRDWVSIFPLWKTRNKVSEIVNAPSGMMDLVAMLIAKIASHAANAEDAGKPDYECMRAWECLLWLDHLGFVRQESRQAIGEVLWAGSTTWPVIPNHFAEASALWPAPEGVDAKRVLREWLLGKQLAKFDAPATVQIATPTVSKQWGFPVNDAVLRAWKASLASGPWSAEEMARGLRILKNWWDDEWASVVADIPKVEELSDAVITRLDYFDAILAVGLPSDWESSPVIDPASKAWLKEMMVVAKPHGAHFWRLRLRHALDSSDVSDFAALQRELSECFLDASKLDAAYVAAHVVEDWIKLRNSKNLRPPEQLLDVLCEIVAARQMPNLIWALHLLVKTAQYQEQWITDRMFQMMEFGLKKLLSELKYHDRDSSAGILDDEVPILRLNCARLALAFSEKSSSRMSNVLSEWLEQARGDPLPEMRFIEERQSNSVS
jgi:hypothetical protein